MMTLDSKDEVNVVDWIEQGISLCFVITNRHQKDRERDHIRISPMCNKSKNISPAINNFKKFTGKQEIKDRRII